jgi:site-specific recombinase XerD
VDEEGNLWLKYRRKKTKQTARVKLLPEAIALVEKYRDKNRETLFPVQHYSILRGNMKVLGIMAGLTQDISYHMARHSCSMLMLSCGLSIESIAKIMGHTNISSTQIYAKVTDTKISEDMDRLMVRRQKNGSAASR